MQHHVAVHDLRNGLLLDLWPFPYGCEQIGVFDVERRFILQAIDRRFRLKVGERDEIQAAYIEPLIDLWDRIRSVLLVKIGVEQVGIVIVEPGVPVGRVLASKKGMPSRQ